MTLILSVISPRWAMQASDRTVTALNAAGEAVGHEDERNKAIFVAERMTFAYTGHADIGGSDTAEWFQAQLGRCLSAGQSADAALDEAAEMVAQYFRALPPHVEDRHHAFVGVGWTEADVATRRPFIVCLSNSVADDGSWLQTPQDSFRRYEETLHPGDGFALFVAGAPVSDQAIGYLSARIASHLDGSDDAAPVARMLIEAIREEAQSNRAIGEGVMVNSLPIAPGPPTGDVMLVGGMPERDVRTFTYVRHGGWDGRYLGPLVVSSDGTQMGSYEATGTQIGPLGGTTGISYRPASAPPMPKSATGQSVRLYKFGRNDPCWCGSGKKYKKCHGANAR